MKDVSMFLAAGVPGNKGAGCYSVILAHSNTGKEFVNSVDNTTHHRAELNALVEGMKKLNQACHVTVCTTSPYVAGNYKNLQAWKENRWRRKNNTPIANSDLWEELLNQINRTGSVISFHIIKREHNARGFQMVSKKLENSAFTCRKGLIMDVDMTMEL